MKNTINILSQVSQGQNQKESHPNLVQNRDRFNKLITKFQNLRVLNILQTS